MFFSLIHCGRSSVMFVSWIAMILITKTAFLSLFTSDDAKKKTKKERLFHLLSGVPLSIQVAQSKVGMNNMEAWLHPALYGSMV